MKAVLLRMASDGYTRCDRTLFHSGDTSPTGTLQDNMGFAFRNVTWTAQSLTGGQDVTESWDSRSPTH